jgi:copper chaperone CopZ
MRKLVLNITGMSCGHCLNAVSKALHSKPGVQVDSVEIGRAVVSYDERITDPTAIENAVTEAGYSATAVPSERDGAQERV